MNKKPWGLNKTSGSKGIPVKKSVISKTIGKSGMGTISHI